MLATSFAHVRTGTFGVSASVFQPGVSASQPAVHHEATACFNQVFQRVTQQFTTCPRRVSTWCSSVSTSSALYDFLGGNFALYMNKYKWPEAVISKWQDVYFTRDTSRMGTARVKQEEEADTRIISKEE